MEIWKTNGAPSRLGLVLALAAAALLRFWALSQGVPFGVQVDEPEVMVRAVGMMKTGDLNPHFFDYPSLYMYMEAVVAVARFLVGAMQGQWSSLAQAPTEAFYVWGRALTAVMGTATVWVVFQVGLRWSRPVALLAAVMFAVMPLHVRESHFVLTDVPMTFFVMITLLMSLRAHERATVRAFALAGVAAGLAGATKYNGVVAVVIPLLACAMTPATRPSRVVAMLWIVAAAIATFLVAAPYTLIDLPTFLNQFARLSAEFRAPATFDDPVWLIYLKHLRNALQWPGMVIVAAGVILGLFKVAAGPDRAKWALITIFPLLYFRFISNQTLFYGRYLLPLVPFLSLLGAAAVAEIVRQFRQAPVAPAARNAVIIVLTIIAIAPPAYTSIEFNANAAKVWTTEQAYTWLMKEVPAGAKITLESRQILLPKEIYDAAYLPQLRMRPVEYFIDRGVEYLVASSQCYGPYFEKDGPQKYPVEHADYMRIFNQTQEIARFTPSDDHPGPELRILKMTKVTQ